MEDRILKARCVIFDQIHYNITEADPALDVKCLEGGFGRDSIPGIDYPIVEAPGSPKGYALRDRQTVFGVALDGMVISRNGCLE